MDGTGPSGGRGSPLYAGSQAGQVMKELRSERADDDLDELEDDVVFDVGLPGGLRRGWLAGWQTSNWRGLSPTRGIGATRHLSSGMYVMYLAGDWKSMDSCASSRSTELFSNYFQTFLRKVGQACRDETTEQLTVLANYIPPRTLWIRKVNRFSATSQRESGGLPGIYFHRRLWPSPHLQCFPSRMSMPGLCRKPGLCWSRTWEGCDPRRRRAKH